jgi:isopentenyl-diphosphate delta-isomerase
MTISQRKADHIDLCADGDVGFAHKTTLLEDVELLHEALPELSLDDVDISVTLLGKRLRAPLIIAAMTGGTERARTINRELAAIAEARGYGFGFGSQRPMLDQPDPSYAVRDVAPTALVLGNLGAVQARALETARVAELCDQVGADAMCIHLNAAMELVQPDGDRDFRGLLDTLARLSRELGRPLIAKETGCGFAPATLARLKGAGVRHVDVSGAGGTSWVAVETERASGEARSLGEALREWGVPTAASVAYARDAAMDTIIATGGVSTGLDVARAIALGADAAGMARPILQAREHGGAAAAEALLARVESELRAVMLLVGARDVATLQRTPFVAGPTLTRWLDARGR